jgi:hypothetical protein
MLACEPDLQRAPPIGIVLSGAIQAQPDPMHGAPPDEIVRRNQPRSSSTGKYCG